MSMNPGSVRCGHWEVLPETGCCSYCGLDADAIFKLKDAMRKFEVIAKAWALENDRGDKKMADLKPHGTELGLDNPEIDRIYGSVMTWLAQRKLTKITKKAVWKSGGTRK